MNTVTAALSFAIIATGLLFGPNYGKSNGATHIWSLGLICYEEARKEPNSSRFFVPFGALFGASYF